MSIYSFRRLNSTTLQHTNQCQWPYCPDYRIKPTFISNRPFHIETVTKEFKEKIVLKLTNHYEINKQIGFFNSDLLFPSIFLSFLFTSLKQEGNKEYKWFLVNTVLPLLIPKEHPPWDQVLCFLLHLGQVSGDWSSDSPTGRVYCMTVWCWNSSIWQI